MKNISLLIIALITMSINAIAQNGKVELCEKYDKLTGATSGIYQKWDINKKDGGYIYIVYNQDRTIKEKLMLYVDKLNDKGEYVAYDTQNFENDVNNGKKWAMYDYKFTEEGYYKIMVMGKSDNPLATVTTNIAYIKEDKTTSSSDDYEDDEDAKDTYYYENSIIKFGTDVKDGDIVGETETFKLKNGKVDIVTLLTQDDALKSKSLTVSIYGGTDYTDKIDEIKFSLSDLSWNWVKLPFTIKTKGKFVVDIYNEHDTFINSGYFTVE
ncbi:MAG: hypothetical protein R2807_10065 [Chitinophagales bacterium]